MGACIELLSVCVRHYAGCWWGSACVSSRPSPEGVFQSERGKEKAGLPGPGGLSEGPMMTLAYGCLWEEVAPKDVWGRRQ